MVIIRSWGTYPYKAIVGLYVSGNRDRKMKRKKYPISFWISETFFGLFITVISCMGYGIHSQHFLKRKRKKKFPKFIKCFINDLLSEITDREITDRVETGMRKKVAIFSHLKSHNAAGCRYDDVTSCNWRSLWPSPPTVTMETEDAETPGAPPPPPTSGFAMADSMVTDPPSNQSGQSARGVWGRPETALF